jgi:hypothetical protein
MRRRPLSGLRRRLGAATLGLATLAAVASPAVSTSAVSASPTAGTTVCSFPSGDSRFTGVTGLVATSKGYDIVNDTDTSGLSIYTLNSSTCKITDSTTSYSATPFDSQDLGRTPDGARWIADTGNENGDRSSVALWEFPKNSDQATEYDLSYPSGVTDINTKALLMGGNDTPTLVSYGSPTRVYQPTGTLSDQQTNQLELVGTIAFKYTDTPGGQLAQAGQKVVTGGAVSPDGKKVLLRTYTDAYEWDVKGGDIAKSIVSGKPRRTPLPNEPGGEAISFSADGSSYVTVSDSSTSATDAKILRYSPTAVAAATHAANSGNTSSSGGLFSHQLTESDIIDMLVAVGVIGFGLVVLGIVGIRRSRRRTAAASRGDPTGPGPRRTRPGGAADAETVVLPRVADGAAHQSRAEPPSPRRRRYREDPPDTANAETAVIDRIVDREPSRDGYQPTTRQPAVPPPPVRHRREEPPPQYGDGPPSQYGDGPAGPPPGQGGGAYRASTYRGAPEPPERYAPPVDPYTAPPVDPYERRAHPDPIPPQPAAAPPPARYQPPRHEARPQAAPPSPEEIDWLEDMRDGAPPLHRDPPPEQPSGQIRRRLR